MKYQTRPDAPGWTVLLWRRGGKVYAGGISPAFRLVTRQARQEPRITS